jgi:hypothetical protein
VTAPEPRSVPIRVYAGEQAVTLPELWRLGTAWRWGKDVWGLEYAGRMTHMCYDASYAVPAEALEKVRKFGWWYFDAGNELRVKVEDLEAGFKALGLLDKERADEPA